MHLRELDPLTSMGRFQEFHPFLICMQLLCIYFIVYRGIARLEMKVHTVVRGPGAFFPEENLKNECQMELSGGFRRQNI